MQKYQKSTYALRLVAKIKELVSSITGNKIGGHGNLGAHSQLL